MSDILIDILLVVMFLMVVIAVGACVWGVWRTMKYRSRDAAVVNGVPVMKTAAATAGFTAVLLLLTFLFGSSESMMINGKAYSDSFWLKAADMFVVSAVIMVIVAAIAIVAGKRIVK